MLHGIRGACRVGDIGDEARDARAWNRLRDGCARALERVGIHVDEQNRSAFGAEQATCRCADARAAAGESTKRTLAGAKALHGLRREAPIDLVRTVAF
jgi:hypothetical protein